MKKNATKIDNLQSLSSCFGWLKEYLRPSYNSPFVKKNPHFPFYKTLFISINLHMMRGMNKKYIDNLEKKESKQDRQENPLLKY